MQIMTSHDLTTRQDASSDLKFDHVAVRVADRDAVADRISTETPLRVLDRTERLTLMGTSKAGGKLTLLDAKGDQAASDKRAAAGAHDDEACEHRLIAVSIDDEHGVTQLDIELTNVESSEGTKAATLLRDQHGCSPTQFVLHPEDASFGAPRDHVRVGNMQIPAVLDHVGLLVDDAVARAAASRAQGIEVLDVVHAANTVASFEQGPAGMVIEYVEHLPGFIDG